MLGLRTELYLIKSTNDDGDDVVQIINSVSDLPVYRAPPPAAAAGGGGATDYHLLS